MPAHMAYPQSHALLHDWGPGRGRTRSIHEWMERARRPPQKYARFRTSVCTGSATSPSDERLRGPRTAPNHAAISLARSRIDRCPPGEARRQRRRGSTCSHCAAPNMAAHAACPPDLASPTNTSPFLLQPITSSRRRAAVCRVAPRPPSPILSPTSPLHNIYSRDAHTAP